MEANQVGSDEARRNFRELLNAVEHKGEHITVLRYDTPAAVIVPVEWYEQKHACAHHEEYYEVVVQADPGGKFFTSNDGPHERYPDVESAAEWARTMQRHFHCVRIKHVMADWLMPDGTGERTP